MQYRTRCSHGQVCVNMGMHGAGSAGLSCGLSGAPKHYRPWPSPEPLPPTPLLSRVLILPPCLPATSSLPSHLHGVPAHYLSGKQASLFYNHREANPWMGGWVDQVNQHRHRALRNLRN